MLGIGLPHPSRQQHDHWDCIEIHRFCQEAHGSAWSAHTRAMPGMGLLEMRLSEDFFFGGGECSWPPALTNLYSLVRPDVRLQDSNDLNLTLRQTIQWGKTKIPTYFVGVVAMFHKSIQNNGIHDEQSWPYTWPCWILELKNECWFDMRVKPTFKLFQTTIRWTKIKYLVWYHHQWSSSTC